MINVEFMFSAASNKTTPKNCAGLTIASNSSSVVDYLDNVLERSKVMYDAGGYLHWYWKHGALRVSTAIRVDRLIFLVV